MGWGSLIPVGKVTDTVDPIALIYSSDGEAEAHRVLYSHSSGRVGATWGSTEGHGRWSRLG